MKRVKLPEEDRENPGKGRHPRKETGAGNRAGTGEGGKDPAPGDTPLQPAFLAGPSSGGSEQGKRGRGRVGKIWHVE